MKPTQYYACLLVVAFTVVASLPLAAQGQKAAHAYVLVPDSTIEHASDVGTRAHTNHLVLVRPELSLTSPGGETPASLACVYQTSSASLSTGCPIATTTALPNGGSGVIAIVDAYDYPTAENDLNVFSSQFGLPPCTTANGCFQKVYASGSKPRSNCGWAQEAALDIEWAHAMAPNARIVLVEAASNSFSNLFFAVDIATTQVGGKGEVSMSWGGSEFSSEASNDSHFQHTGVVYFASSGDTGGKTIYPSASPYVVAAGGTTVNRDASSGNFVSETGWSGSGGGPSQYESKPSYQSGIANTSPTQRSIPDFSFDANPNTGVSVYDSTSCQGLSGWLVFGGTSVASPSLAGIVNDAGHFLTSSTSELSTICSSYTNTSDFRDIISGTAGGFSAGLGWDFVTGVGSNVGLSGK
jgi:subtilase family serine protease